MSRVVTGERARRALGTCLLVGVAAAGCSGGRSVDLGPESRADVVVCLDRALTSEAVRVFRESRPRGDLLAGAGVADYTAQSDDSVTLNWETSAAQHERDELISALRAEPEIVSVGENTTVVDECRS